MKMVTYFGTLTSLAMIDLAAIWQFYSYQGGNSLTMLILIIILLFLGFAIIGGALALQSQKNDEDQDDDDDDTFEPEPPPSLPDTTSIPSCMRGYMPSSVHRDTVLKR
ncbi:MAG: hypothetical protein WC536_04210 [Patescibacteria group bacterium]